MYLNSSSYCCARRNANENTFLCCEVARGQDGSVGVNLNDVVDQRGVTVLGNKSSPNALYLVRAGLATAKNRRLLWLHSDYLETWVAGAQKLSRRIEYA
jgi:hypothetical protein